MKSIPLYKCFPCGRLWRIAGGCIACPKCNSDLVEVEEERKSKEPLLTIELQDETSVPTVYHKGKEIKLKTNVKFEWEADTDELGGLTYYIEHYERTGVPTLNKIERKIKGHAFD